MLTWTYRLLPDACSHGILLEDVPSSWFDCKLPADHDGDHRNPFITWATGVEGDFVRDRVNV